MNSPCLYFRDILYLVTLQHVHSLCMENSLWSAAAVYGEIALPDVRRYAGQRSRVVAALLVGSVDMYIALRVVHTCI